MRGNKTNTIILWSMLALALLVIVGCAPTVEIVKEEVKQPVKMGFLAPLTGDVAAIGLNNRAGAEMAVKEINNAGGINGRPIEMIYEDGKCNAKDATTAARKLVNIDKVVAIVGGVCSSETLAAAPVAEGKTVLMSPGSSSPDITDAGDYIFRNYPSDVFQGAYAAEFAYNELGARKAVILYCLSDWCVGLDNRFRERFQELGGEIILEDSFEQNSKDLRTQLTKTKNVNPDIIYFVGYTDSTVTGLTQAKEMGIKTQILGADAWDDPAIPQRAGNAADGAIFVRVFAPDNEEFKAKMKAHTGSDVVTLATPQAYDAVRILVGVMRQVGTNPADIKDALYRVKYSGISGDISFDENGDLATAAYEVMEYRDGKSINYEG